MQRLLTPLEEGRAEAVFGSRMLDPGAARRGNIPLYKFVGNRILSTAQNWLLRTRFSEFHSGYRAYSVHALAQLPLEELSDSWHFDTQIILELLARGGRIVEVPIPTYYRVEICRVNGMAYAWNCVRVTAGFVLPAAAGRSGCSPLAAQLADSQLVGLQRVMCSGVLLTFVAPLCRYCLP